MDDNTDYTIESPEAAHTDEDAEDAEISEIIEKMKIAVDNGASAGRADGAVMTAHAGIVCPPPFVSSHVARRILRDVIEADDINTVRFCKCEHHTFRALSISVIESESNSVIMRFSDDNGHCFTLSVEFERRMVRAKDQLLILMDPGLARVRELMNPLAIDKATIYWQNGTGENQSSSSVGWYESD